MRILFVVHDFLPKHPSGTEIYTAQLARRLADRGHDVHVFTTEKDIARPNGALVEREWDGLPVEELTNNLFYERFEETWSYAPAEEAFGATLERFRPDVVHFMHLLYLSGGMARQARAAGAGVAMTLHDFWLQCPRFGQRLHPDGTVCHTIERRRCAECLSRFKFAQEPLERRVAAGVAWTNEHLGIDASSFLRTLKERLAPAPGASPDFAPDADRAQELEGELAERERFLREDFVPFVQRFFAPSRFLYERFLEWGLAPERLEHLTYGLDTEPFRDLARVPSDTVRIAFIGTLAPHKGPHVLLAAWGALDAAERAGAQLMLFGPRSHNPAYVAELEARARAVGATLAGGLARDEVPAVLARTDLLVVPSTWYENSPLTIHEAGAAGVALAVSDLGGMAELVTPGVNGWRFRPGDAADLARVLRDAVGDRAALAALGGAPPKDMRVSAEEMEARYLTLLDEARA
ncbi:MAG: glycosyltransferase [Planctomycetota bacterium]